jgi:quercetin dioxygenase-like cupin family protein
VTLQPAFHEDAGTTHDYDQVVVALAPSDISLTMDGKAKTNWKAGEVAFIGRGAKHESANTGQKPADVFILAIK